MRLLRPASEDDMVAAFLAGEAASPRYGAQIREILAGLGQPRSLVEQPDTRDNAANAMRRKVLAGHRGYPAGGMFTGMPADVTWRQAALTAAELATVRYLDWPYWTEFSAGACWPPTVPAGLGPGRTSRLGRSTGRSLRTLGRELPPPLILLGQPGPGEPDRDRRPQAAHRAAAPPALAAPNWTLCSA
jgi:hypothetical protein